MLYLFCNNDRYYVKEKEYAILQFENDTLDLGLIELGDTIVSFFNYVNIGKFPLIIRDIQTSCGCSKPRWSKEPILAEKSGEIEVTFEPIKKRIFL